MSLLEISSKTDKNGYRKFKLALLKIYSDDSIQNETGTEYNDNGITWLEKYCKANISTIEDMSLTVEFLDEERTEILGHGSTGEIKDGVPILKNATSIGHFKRGYITENNGEKLLIGEGLIDYMRYPDFVDSLKEKINDNEMIYGSVEIIPLKNNDSIEYLYGYKDKGRIPTNFEFSGYALLGGGVEPADNSARLLELANKRKGKESVKMMDEKTIGIITDTVKSAISECNSNSEKYENKITELNKSLSERDNKIEELNSKIETVEKALADLQEEHNKKCSEMDTFYEERETLLKELGELKAKARIDELEKATSDFSEKEKECVKKEIEEFKKDPNSIEIDSIVDKIYSEIGKSAKKKNVVSEQNSIDMFADIDDVTADDKEFSIYD